MYEKFGMRKKGCTFASEKKKRYYYDKQYHHSGSICERASR